MWRLKLYCNMQKENNRTIQFLLFHWDWDWMASKVSSAQTKNRGFTSIQTDTWNTRHPPEESSGTVNHGSQPIVSLRLLSISYELYKYSVFYSTTGQLQPKTIFQSFSKQHQHFQIQSLSLCSTANGNPLFFNKHNGNHLPHLIILRPHHCLPKPVASMCCVFTYIYQIFPLKNNQV